MMSVQEEIARLARILAGENFHGSTNLTLGNLYPFAKVFEGIPDATLEALDRDWSGAFAYVCVKAAGIDLPLRYPDTRVPASFAHVEGWVAYAKLPKIGAWRSPGEMPRVGDLTVFEVPEDKPPQIGVVLAIGEKTMEVAVGNYRGHSAITEKPLDEGIKGLIRLV